jgi:hypothetical protein
LLNAVGAEKLNIVERSVKVQLGARDTGSGAALRMLTMMQITCILIPTAVLLMWEQLVMDVQQLPG